jgi:benzoyl-CoA reductase/2-hydroxyglutaryl-CoA dehydratase subunit BcrC/BadD/HgdB
MFTQLLTLCGYEPEEIEEQRPRVDRAFEKLGIYEEDIKRGEERIKQTYDVSLKGVRMLLGAWMRELVHLALAGEEKKKIIYGEWPGPANIILMAAVHQAKDVYFGTPASQVLNTTMGCIFDKLTPLLEAGEENGGLTPAGNHCAMFKTSIGAITTGRIPKPDLVCAPGWLCDQPAEYLQVLQEVYDIPVVYHDGCLDWQYGEWPNLGMRQVKYSGASLRKVKQKVEEVAEIELSDDALNKGFQDLTGTYFNFQTIVEMMGKADPQPISQSNLELAYFTFYTVLQDRSRATNGMTTLIREIKQRITEGKGVVPKGAPRIFNCMRFPVDHAMMRMIEDTGLNVCVCLADKMLPGSLDNLQSTDACDLMIEAVYNLGGPLIDWCGIEGFETTVAKYFNVDGVIQGYPKACRLASAPFMMRDKFSEKMDLPVLTLEYDGYDNREYTAGQLKTRVETFAEMLKMRKAAKAV